MGSSTIEWTKKTWNPIVGCSIESPGCHHCYAALMARRLRAMAIADLAKGIDPGRKRHYIDVVDDDGRWTGKLAEVPEALADPLKWKKPTTIFVNSMSDLFHESLSFEFITAVFGVMTACPQHTLQVLTKRIERAVAWWNWIIERGGLGTFIRSKEGRDLLRGYFDTVAKTEVVGRRHYRANDDPWSQVMNGAACHMGPRPLSNVLIGPSIEDQKRLDERMPHAEALADLGWHVMLSCEPLLGPLSFYRHELGKMRWVILGGESGPESRLCCDDWIRRVVTQCRSVDVATFVKQLGQAHRRAEQTVAENMIANGCFHTKPDPNRPKFERLKLRDKKGADPAEWDAELRVRQSPDLSAKPKVAATRSPFLFEV